MEGNKQIPSGLTDSEKAESKNIFEIFQKFMNDFDQKISKKEQKQLKTMKKWKNENGLVDILIQKRLN